MADLTSWKWYLNVQTIKIEEKKEFCSSADVKLVPLGNQANFMSSYLDLWGAPLSHQVLEFGQDEAGNTPGFPVELESEDQLLHNHLRVGGWTVKTKDIEWYKPTNRKSQTVQLISPLDGTQKLPLPYSRSTRVIFFLFISDNSVTWYDMSIPQADSPNPKGNLRRPSLGRGWFGDLWLNHQYNRDFLQ